jgi:glutaminyl-peptide cyclotransferase
MIIKKSIIFLLFVLIIGELLAVADESQKNQLHVNLNITAPISSINIINIFTHDSKAFTQGLIYHNGYLYESTGLKGKSSLRKVDIRSGRVLQEFKLEQKYFAEGITIHNNKIYQLTWKNKIAFVYDLVSFKLLKTFVYPWEGWGITSDGKNLFMSNGSEVIVCIDPEDFKVVRKINVHDGKITIGNINELEYIGGEIWANIFMEKIIVRISPITGDVIGWIDLSELYNLLPDNYRVDVLNGIAYDQEGDRIFVTGKFWPKLFEIKLTTNR